MVAYCFEDDRGADYVARQHSGFTGTLQVDGYSAYTSLVKLRAKTGSNETVRLAGCWAHLRRKFYDLHISGVSKATTITIVTMVELWRVADEARGGSPDSRAALRKVKSAAIVADLFDLRESELGKLSGQSKTAEAIRYALTRREALERFLNDGRIEIDFQHRRTGDQAANHYETEQSIRRQRGRRTNLGHAGYTPADGQDEQCRSARLALSDPDPHRLGLARI